MCLDTEQVMTVLTGFSADNLPAPAGLQGRLCNQHIGVDTQLLRGLFGQRTHVFNKFFRGFKFRGPGGYSVFGYDSLMCCRFCNALGHSGMCRYHPVKRLLFDQHVLFVTQLPYQHVGDTQTAFFRYFDGQLLIKHLLMKLHLV